MAFGFGFNKQKVLSAAEKCVQQGKLQNAISEYEKILKADPKDLTVMNTVGDLYARLGDSNKAAEFFKNVGEAYAGQGFTVKAIAMYKKLSKVRPATECVLRLAELYTQQGLFNDARAQYLLVAENFVKSGQMDQAVKILQKTLEMDPENISMRTRLADVYVKMGKKPEAWQLLTAATESLRSKGQVQAADEILQRMLQVDPGSSYALVLHGRAAVEAGNFAAAIECLTKVADLDNNPEGLRALFQAYLRSQRFEDASALAAKLANVHDDISAITEYADALMEAQRYPDALQIYKEFADRLLRADPGKLTASLRALVRHVQDDPRALEQVLGIFQKAGDNSQFTDIYELLAHGYVQSGDLEKARDYYLKLTQLEPANQMHARNYQQVVEKLGSSSPAPHLITPEEGSVLMDELEATAPVVEQRYDDDVALAVQAALTDAELFASYNMAAKALDPLISTLPKAPRDVRLNQKLAALHTRAGRLAEAAVCCRTLESVYHDAGYSDEASRYGELAAKCEQRTRGNTEPLAKSPAPAATAEPGLVQEFEIAPSLPPVDESAREAHSSALQLPEAPVASSDSSASGLFFHGATPAVPAAQSLQPGIGEIPELPAAVDLSSEWEQHFSIETAQPADHAAIDAKPQSISPTELQTEEPTVEVTERESAPAEAATSASPAPNLDESIEEVRFYLGQGMVEQAEQVLAKAEALSPAAPELAVLRLGIESSKQAGPQAEVSIEESLPTEPSVAEAPHPSANAPAYQQPWPAERPLEPEPAAPGDAPVYGGSEQPEQPAAEAALADSNANFRSGTLDDFVADLEASLGNDFVEAPEPVSAPEAIAQAEVPMARAAAASAEPSRVASPPAPVFVAPPAVPVSAPPQPAVSAAPETLDSVTRVDLSDMFGELKQELEHDAGGADEDPETHYNLGVAFREMGLLDEAIGELQKVCQFVDRGHAFPQIMQTYTWLAQCFLDKGVPESAVRWYERALKLPSLDQETRTALHYELGSSLESAGNNPAALSNFLEVYSSNIDYRDVGERIKALRT